MAKLAVILGVLLYGTAVQAGWGCDSNGFCREQGSRMCTTQCTSDGAGGSTCTTICG